MFDNLGINEIHIIKFIISRIRCIYPVRNLMGTETAKLTHFRNIQIVLTAFCLSFSDF